MVNEYFHITNYGGTLEFYVFELANFSVLACLVLIIYKLDFINENSLIVWLCLFFSPLLFNYFIFSPNLFGDQFVYAAEIMSLKTTGESYEHTQASGSLLLGSNAINPVTFTAKILGIIPLPAYMTVTSLAFANKFILFLTFLWFKRFFNSENEVLLYFLIPSLVLYSSIGLRDTLVMVLTIIFIINLVRGRFILPILLLYPMAILKIQMFAVLALYLVGRIIFQAHKTRNLFIFFLCTIFAFVVIYHNAIIEIVNLYRLAFVAENFIGPDGSISYEAWGKYGKEEQESLMITSIPEVIYLAVINLPVLMLIPMPWNWSNIFYPIQFIENILLIYLYTKLALENKVYKSYELILLTLILILGLSLYALIMANEGTFVRYRFTLYYPFLLGLLYISKQHQNNTDGANNEKLIYK